MLDLDHLAQLDAALNSDAGHEDRIVLPSFERQTNAGVQMPDASARCPHLAARVGS